jgi:hypothetical protein
MATLKDPPDNSNSNSSLLVANFCLLSFLKRFTKGASPNSGCLNSATHKSDANLRLLHHSVFKVKFDQQLVSTEAQGLPAETISRESAIEYSSHSLLRQSESRFRAMPNQKTRARRRIRAIHEAIKPLKILSPAFQLPFCDSFTTSPTRLQPIKTVAKLKSKIEAVSIMKEVEVDKLIQNLMLRNVRMLTTGKQQIRTNLAVSVAFQMRFSISSSNILSFQINVTWSQKLLPYT